MNVRVLFSSARLLGRSIALTALLVATVVLGAVSGHATPAAAKATVVPFYRLYSDNDHYGDHFYTTSWAEALDFSTNRHYKYEWVAAGVSPGPGPGLVPLYRLYSTAQADHFYTTSWAVAVDATNNRGYERYEGIAAYVSPGPGPDYVPLYQLYSPSTDQGDHFYTTNTAEAYDAQYYRGYRFPEGIAAYVWPVSAITADAPTPVAITANEYWSAARGDNFLATSDQERAVAVAAGYTWVRSETVYATQASGMAPLKLFWNAAREDNFSTATAQGENAALASGYIFVRIQGYVYTDHQTGLVPLKLFWSASRGDNFTTASAQGEHDALAAGYVFVRIEGWV